MDLQVAVAAAGLWWAVGGAAAAKWLRKRRGPAFPGGDGKWKLSRIAAGWRAAISEVAPRGALPRYVFSAAALHGLASAASWGLLLSGFLLARDYLCLSSAHLAGLASLLCLSAALAAPLSHYLQRLAALDNRLMASLFLYLLSFPPAFLLALRPSPLSIALFAASHGLSSRLLFSYSRTLFLDLIPTGLEGALLSLFTATQHSGAWLASLIVTSSPPLSHSRRLYILLLLIIALALVVLILLIDNQKGLLSAGHVKIWSDSDDYPVSSVSTGDIVSSPFSKSPIDVADLMHKLTHTNIPFPCPSPCVSSLRVDSAGPSSYSEHSDTDQAIEADYQKSSLGHEIKAEMNMNKGKEVLPFDNNGNLQVISEQMYVPISTEEDKLHQLTEGQLMVRSGGMFERL